MCIKTCIEYTQPARYELIADFGARAARIAGNYAHIYLELEKNGKPQLKRRFYWTGLAAFASKQVMCALDYTSQTKMRTVPFMDLSLDLSKQFLGMGNFWLFQDIFVWHWFYINFPQQFNECIEARDFNEYDDRFIAAFQKLPRVKIAIPEINALKVTDHLRQGFELIKKLKPPLLYQIAEPCSFCR
ncbi:hypothetical protein V2L07_26620 [Pseudomonas alliivorans]|nr:hypothetical protein [Pseudomonas alliivorans]